MRILGSCSRGDEGVLLHLESFRVRAGASPSSRGLYPLPQPTARRPIADFGSGIRYRASVTSGGFEHEYSLAGELDAAWASAGDRMLQHCQLQACKRIAGCDLHKSTL